MKHAGSCLLQSDDCVDPVIHNVRMLCTAVWQISNCYILHVQRELKSPNICQKNPELQFQLLYALQFQTTLLLRCR